MKVVVFVRATPETEAGATPPAELADAMGRYNQALIEAGIMQAGEGLRPSSAGARIVFKGGEPMVVDGPFAETKELIAGFWVWEVADMAEAVAWARRCPNPTPMGDGSGVLEIRPVWGIEFLGENDSPERRAIHEDNRRRMEERGAR